MISMISTITASIFEFWWYVIISSSKFFFCLFSFFWLFVPLKLYKIRLQTFPVCFWYSQFSEWSSVTSYFLHVGLPSQHTHFWNQSTQVILLHASLGHTCSLQVIDFVKKHVGGHTPQLAGNSVYVDFLFLKVRIISPIFLFH